MAERTMNADTVTRVTTLAAAVAILAFLWTLHTDIADLRERMARLEGRVEGMGGQINTLLQVVIDSDRGRDAG